MSTFYTKLMAATGIATCLGVLTLPLGAATAATTDSKNVTVSATVDKIISITTSGTISPTSSLVAGGDPATATGTITVATNSTSGFVLSLVATGGNNSLTSGGNSIPATSNVNPVAKGNSAWGIQCSSSDTDIDPDYTSSIVPVPTTSDTLKTYNTNTSSNITTVTYHFSAATIQPSGTYTGSITYTATAQ